MSEIAELCDYEYWIALVFRREYQGNLMLFGAEGEGIGAGAEADGDTAVLYAEAMQRRAVDADRAVPEQELPVQQEGRGATATWSGEMSELSPEREAY